MYSMAKAGGEMRLSTAHRSSAFLEISDFSNVVKCITYTSFMHMGVCAFTLIKVIFDEILPNKYLRSYVMWALKCTGV